MSQNRFDQLFLQEDLGRFAEVTLENVLPDAKLENSGNGDFGSVSLV